MVVAAIALVALDVAHRNSRRLFKIDDDGTEGLAVTRVAQCLGVQHEVPALEWPSLCLAIRAVPTPISLLPPRDGGSIEIKSLEDFRDFFPHSLIQP
jgi:hypothetical protein